MHMRTLLLIITLVAALAGSAVAADTPRRPNIVLIVSDDQGYAEMSCQGGDIPTPHLDALAKSGVRCTAGYVTAPYCSPSRAALITGRYQQRFGFEFNPVERTNDLPGVGLPVAETTLPQRLKAAGYVTGMVGKWHLGVHEPMRPLKRGFDEFYGFLREGHYYLPPPFDGPPERVMSHLRAREPDYNRLNPILRGEQEIEETRYLTAALGEEAVGFIRKHRDHPFFLYLPFNAPHSPMQATPADYARFKHITDPHRRVWAAMVAAMDDAIGKVLGELRAAGLERDTLVVFLSDNGGPTRELTSRNDPFSGGKGSLLEGGVRVPFIVSFPGRLPAGVVYDRPVSALDVVPTALAAAGIAPKADDSLDGIDLLPFLGGGRKNDPHSVLYWRMGPQAAIRKGDWKLVRPAGAKAFRLHDLSTDPTELKDLSAEKTDIAADLLATYDRWSATLAAPRWGPGQPAAK
jgi:arylsulfatase B